MKIILKSQINKFLKIFLNIWVSLKTKAATALLNWKVIRLLLKLQGKKIKELLPAIVVRDKLYFIAIKKRNVADKLTTALLACKESTLMLNSSSFKNVKTLLSCGTSSVNSLKICNKEQQKNTESSRNLLNIVVSIISKL